MRLKLFKADYSIKDELIEMLEEWSTDIKENNTNHSPYAIFKNDWHNFDYYLDNLEIKVSENAKVPDTTLFAYDVNVGKLVGAVNIRHYLNDDLLYSGGHIGDGIRPSERGKGYGTELVSLALHECKKLGITKVLMCCDINNIASEKTIINNGGILENEVKEDNSITKRYWIDLENKD